ncbi:MAG: S-layer protein [Methanomicrobiales archaeon]|nr:S-layer protein [Methanomicrobiales archaeon]
MNFRAILSVVLVFLLACTFPVMGVTTYLSPGPSLSAAVSGTNEFTPGQDAVITVVILNSGTNDMKQVMTGTIDRDDLPTTAKMVTVSLAAGSAPVKVKSDPQNIGDITSHASQTVAINAKITNDATEGEYTLPLNLTYTHLADASEVAADVLQSKYRTSSVIVPLTIRIKPQVKIEVLEATADKLSVGTGGYITLKIRNLGFEDGKKATVKLLRSGTSPVIPTDANVFIGDFPSGGVVTCRYKVAISNEAGKQSYPVNVVVTYENRDGDVVTSSQETIGVPVLDKVTFTAVPESAALASGTEQVVKVRYTNTGEVTAYSAQARLSTVEPFSSADNNAYLGDIRPGESAVALYTIRVADPAEAKPYSLDTEVRYRDALQNSQVSDTIKVTLQVTPAASGGLAGLLPFIVLIAAVLGAGYYLLSRRRNM